MTKSGAQPNRWNKGKHMRRMVHCADAPSDTNSAPTISRPQDLRPPKRGRVQRDWNEYRARLYRRKFTPRSLAAAGLLVLAAFFVAPSVIANANAATDSQCDQLILASGDAHRRGDWSGVLALSRTILSHCGFYLTDGEWIGTVASIEAALVQLGRDSEAVAVADRCIARAPQSIDCHVFRGNALFHLGRLEEARKSYRSALAIGTLTDEEMQMQKTAGRNLALVEEEIRLGHSAHGARRPNNKGSASLAIPTRAGSGFFVTTESYIVTNAHVVDGCTRITTPSGSALTVIQSDDSLDLALLKFAPPQAGDPLTFDDLIPRTDIAKFRAGAPPRIGETVIAFGFPLPGVLSTEGNVTLGILSATLGLGNDPHEFQITAPVQAGNSGGPLLDASGSVIGVVVAKLDVGKVAKIFGDIPQNVNFAVKGSDVIAFLARAHVAYVTQPSTTQLQTADAASLAKGFSIQLFCY